MNIQVKIIEKEKYNEELDIGWSLPVDIDDFILHPNEIEFEWENGDTLPYNDFIFFGEEYYYRIYIDNIPVSRWEKCFGGVFEIVDYIKEIDNI